MSEPERMLFRRLAAFTNGAILDDVEAVASDDALPRTAVLDLLDRLVARSLVVADDEGPVVRFRMLETVRQYAARQLRDAGEADEMADRHAAHYVAELLRIGPNTECAFDVDEFRWCVTEMDNIAHAVRSVLASQRHHDAIEAVWHLSLAWGLVDPPACERLLDAVDAACAESGDAADEPRLRLARTHLQLWAGNLLQCAVEGLACIEAAERTGDEWVAMRARTYVAQVLAWVDPDAALDMQRTGRDAARRLADPVGDTLGTVGIASTYIGVLNDLNAGRPYLDEAVVLSDRLGNPLLQSWATSQQAIYCAFKGHLSEAERWAAIAERHLDLVGQGLGPDGSRAVRRNVILSTTVYAQSCARAQDPDRLDWIESLPQQAARSAAAGYLVLPAMIEVIHGAQMGYLGRYEEAEASLARGRAINERAGTEAAGVSGACLWADLALAAGDLDEAKRRLATVDGSMIALRSIHASARIAKRRAAFALIEGRPLEAERLAHEGLAATAPQGIPLETIELLEVLAQVAVDTDAPGEAARIAGAVAAIRERHGITVRLPWHADRFDDAVGKAGDTLGTEAFTRMFDEGAALSMAEVVAYVQRSRGDRKRPSFGWEGLTPTEAEVVGHVVAGRTNPQIAQAMFVSRETVKTHLSHIFAKLGVRTRAELAARAARREE
ncbi:MAG: LuxR C-terminal-related transcriptional regulator [Microthrixaceae bacterium]